MRAKHQSLHHFVAKSTWSDCAVLEAIGNWVQPALSAETGHHWIIDDTGFPEKGRHSEVESFSRALQEHLSQASELVQEIKRRAQDDPGQAREIECSTNLAIRSEAMKPLYQALSREAIVSVKAEQVTRLGRNNVAAACRRFEQFIMPAPNG